jgi:hypothetical protein
MKIFISVFIALILVATCVHSQDKIILKNTDLITVVITVKTAKDLLAALTTKDLPNEDVVHAMKASLTRSLNGPFPIAEPIPDATK